jgi:hypothetical protein
MAPETSEVAAAARLAQFFGRIGTHLEDQRKRQSFAMYAFGILGDGERKSANFGFTRLGGSRRPPRPCPRRANLFARRLGRTREEPHPRRRLRDT